MPGKGATQRLQRTYTNLPGMTGPRARMLRGSQHLPGGQQQGCSLLQGGGQGLCHVPFMSGLYLLLYVGDVHTNFTLQYKGRAHCLLKLKDLRCSEREH